jgi:fimbrial isopeptide formation D2 family protein
MKNPILFIFVLLCACQQTSAQCFISNYSLLDTATYYTWQSPNVGFVSGSGAFDNTGTFYASAEIAEGFTGAIGLPITGAALSFAYATVLSTDSNAIITIKVYDNTGLDAFSNPGAPGAVIGSTTLTLGQIARTLYSVDSAGYLLVADTVSFTPAPTLATTGFYISAVMPTTTGDTLVLFTDAGGTQDGNGWVSYSNLGWVPYDSLVGGIHKLGNFITVLTCSANLGVSLGNNQTVCSGSNVILNTAVSGGSSPYTYAWSGSGNTLSCNNCEHPAVTLNQNSVYTVTVTDAVSTTATTSIQYTVSTAGALPQITTSNTNITCVVIVDTTTVTVANGISPYTLNWGDGSIVTDTVSAITHVYAAAGDFVITVTDSIGCTSAVFDTILTSGVTITALNEVHPLCGTDSTGKINITASGGTAPYTYSWSNGATSDSISNLRQSYYMVTVLDANQCSASAGYNLISDDGLYYVFLNVTDANCGINGSVGASVTGTHTPFTYLWNNGATTQNITALGAGLYSLTVTDSLGCKAPGSSTVVSNCNSYIEGTLFVDSNNNCVFDSAEEPVRYITVVATNTLTNDQYYAYSDVNGFYEIVIGRAGSYKLSADFYSNTGCASLTGCANNNQTINLSALGDTSSNNNLGFSSTTDEFDLTIHPGWTSANPGFQKEYWVMPYNQSNWPFTGVATVVFTYDSNLIYQYSLPPLPAVDTVNHTLTWHVDTVPSPSFDWVYCRFQNFFLVPSTLSLNYMLQSNFTIAPTAGDCEKANNEMHFSEVVTGSHDPNEKTVTPAGSITDNDSVLTYTIHYQNTGTDSTYFIIVTDTLSPGLDPATVVNLASSDKYSAFNITGSGILKWTFNPLRLPDSITNASTSKGFITFSIRRRANLANGTSISNSATIYFDYNPGVTTNTVSDTLNNPLSISSAKSYSGISVNAFPNPFNELVNVEVTGLNQKFDFELYDVTGRMQQHLISIQNPQFQIQRNGLAAGIYTYRIVADGKPVAYGKLVIE